MSILKKKKFNNRANAYIFNAIGLLIVFICLDVFIFSESPPDFTEWQPKLPEDTGSDWWDGIPIFGGVFDGMVAAWEFITERITFLIDILTVQFSSLSLIAPYDWIVRIYIWVSLTIGIIKLLPFTGG